MPRATPKDFTSDPTPSGKGRPGFDWTNPTHPSPPSGASAAASLPNPASMPAGGHLPFPQQDALAGGPAKVNPATVGAPGGGRRSFRVTGG